MKHTLRIVAIALCVGFIVGSFMTAAQSTSVAATSADPVVMRLGVTQKPDTFNPFAMTLSISYQINFLLYDTLNSVEPDLTPGPQLATSWESSADGTVWTYHIVEGATWHDGVALTANDVSFTYNLILDNPDECALFGNYLLGFTEVVALDDYTLRITTDVPKATMLSLMVPILPEHLWSAVPVDKLSDVDPWDSQYFPDGPIGSGPLMLDYYDQTLGEIGMLKWSGYYIDVVKADEVLYLIFSSDDAMMTALYAGEIDIASGVPARVWDTTLAKDDIEGQAVKALSIFELGINCASAEIRNKADFPTASDNLETCNLAVRQAIAMAVDKTAIISEILKNLADEGESVIPTATDFWHYYVPSDEKWQFDLDEANKTLTAAGYEDTDDDDIRENVSSGVELSFDFYYRSEKVDDQLAAQMISAWLWKIGINAPAQGVTENSLYNIWYQCRYDMYIWAWDTDVDPSFMLSVMTTDEIPDDSTDFTAWSDCFYSNPEYDAMYLEQLNTPDLTERQTIVHEMQSILYRDCPYVVLWYPDGLYAYRTDRFFNFPDMVTYPGMTPGTMWFFFEVMPLGANVAPTDVNAGEDVSAYVGDTVSLTGDAYDQNDAVSTLNWTWVFTEPDAGTSTEYGSTVSYKVLNVGTVDVTLTVTDPGGLSASDSLQIFVAELPEDTGWLEGFVLDQDSGPIAGANVDVGATTRKTDVEGHYNITLPAGAYSVDVSADGYSSDSGDATVLAGVATLMNFTLTVTTGTLVGHVYDAVSGSPVVSATVALSGTANASIMTNSEGYYEFLLLGPGVYTIKVTYSGYVGNETSVTVVAGETTTVDMDLTPEAADGTSSDSGSSTLIIAGAAVAVLAVAGVAAFAMLKRKKDQVPPPPPTQ